MNTNSKAFKDALRAYLAPIIQDHAEDYNATPENLFKWALETAKNELPHVKGDGACMTEWLQGCALGIAIYNYEIIEVSEMLHNCKLTEKQKGKFVAGWFNFIANKIVQFAR